MDAVICDRCGKIQSDKIAKRRAVDIPMFANNRWAVIGTAIWQFGGEFSFTADKTICPDCLRMYREFFSVFMDSLHAIKSDKLEEIQRAQRLDGMTPEAHVNFLITLLSQGRIDARTIDPKLTDRLTYLYNLLAQNTINSQRLNPLPSPAVVNKDKKVRRKRIEVK